MSKSLKRISLVLIAGTLGAVGCARDTTNPVISAMLRESRATSWGGSGRYLLLFKVNGVPRDLAGRVAALGGTVVFQHNAGIAIVAGLNAAGAAALKAGGDVADVEPDAIFKLDDRVKMSTVTRVALTPASVSDPTTAARYSWQWDMRAIHADQAWAAGRLGSPDVTVAIIDSGVDYTNPDLAGHVDLSRSASFVPSEDALVDAYFPGKNYITDSRAPAPSARSSKASSGPRITVPISRT